MGRKRDTCRIAVSDYETGKLLFIGTIDEIAKRLSYNRSYVRMASHLGYIDSKTYRLKRLED